MWSNLLVLATCLAASPFGVRALAPLIGLEVVPSVSRSYIVVLKSGISESDFVSHLTWVDSILRTSSVVRDYTYDFGEFRGYSISVPRSVALLVAESDHIAYIEADQQVHLAGKEEPANLISAPAAADRVVQPNAPWNLARISHRLRGSTDYVYEDVPGIDIYVLDTGVRITHQLFQGRASYGYNVANQTDDDRNGHGTHNAGIVAAATYGVARRARIISVKVLVDGASQTSAGVIAGIDWAVKDMNRKGNANYASCQLSVGSAYSAAFNNAVASAVQAGLFMAVPAGNDNSDASKNSPGSVPSACVVGAVNATDGKTQFTNYGSTVDIFAPGQSITSTARQTDTSTNTFSGTSMSAAHVAGLGAYFLAREGRRSPVALCERLREVATRDAISGLTGLPNTANLLAYNDSGL